MSPTPAPGSYPGNPSLPVEVREKILATFRHALTLFSSSNLSDCLIADFLAAIKMTLQLCIDIPFAKNIY